MATNRKAVKQYILSVIDLDGHDVTATTDNEKIIKAMEICRAEVGHIESREGTQAMIEHWLSGLCSVVSLPYMYCDIIPLAVEWNSLPANYTDKQAEKICENWFRYMACQFLQMVRKADLS